jgi:hypothetical protein
MKCTVTYHDRPAGPGVKPFGTKGDDSFIRRILLDRKLLTHTTNTIAPIVYEIRNAKTDISLRRASTTLLDNRFGQTRIRAGVHQTVSAIVKTMEIDEQFSFFTRKGRSEIGDWNMVKLSVRLNTSGASGSAASALPNHSSALLNFQ